MVLSPDALAGKPGVVKLTIVGWLVELTLWQLTIALNCGTGLLLPATTRPLTRTLICPVERREPVPELMAQGAPPAGMPRIDPADPTYGPELAIIVWNV